MGDKQKHRIFLQRAGNIAAVNNLYTLVQARNDPQAVDSIWAKYEGELNSAIEQLIDRTIDARLWGRVLVPFVACMMVRGPDFADRFRGRLASWNVVDLEADDVNYARMLELQRLLGPILAAKWSVLSVQGPEPVIINDLGFSTFRDTDTGKIGLAIPLTQRRILTLIPTRRRAVAVFRRGRWTPIIEYRALKPGNHLSFNEALAEGARRFFFGPHPAAVNGYIKSKPRTMLVPGPFELGFVSGLLAMVHEFTWHRFIAFLETGDENAFFSEVLDWKAIASGWAPWAIIPLGPPASLLTTAVLHEDNLITVDFNDIRGLTRLLDVGLECPS